MNHGQRTGVLVVTTSMLCDVTIMMSHVFPVVPSHETVDGSDFRTDFVRFSTLITFLFMELVLRPCQ